MKAMVASRVAKVGVFVSLLAAGSCQTSGSGPGHGVESGIDEPILKAGSEWDRRFNAGDAAGLAELYAREVVSMPPNAPTVNGRESVRNEFQSFFAANTGQHQTMTDQIIRQGDLSIERARYVLTYKAKAGGAEVRETGRHVECRRKIAGTWQIVWEIWNTEGTGR